MGLHGSRSIAVEHIQSCGGSVKAAADAVLKQGFIDEAMAGLVDPCSAGISWMDKVTAGIRETVDQPLAVGTESGMTSQSQTSQTASCCHASHRTEAPN